MVNNSVVIVDTSANKHGHKTYIVRSLKYPEAPTYEIKEDYLRKGATDSYTAKNSKKICEYNSLYSVEDVRKYIVDVEQAKKLSKFSKTFIKVYCESCLDIIEIRADRLNKVKPFCELCNKNTPYPELFLLAYLKVMNFEYEYQKSFKELNNKKVDFYIKEIGIIETHGEIHYSDISNMNHERARQSDKEKRDFCNKNNIKLIELDCRKCTFEYIKNSINNCDSLPSISFKNETSISKMIAKNNKYPTTKIIDMYTKGYRVVDIAKECNISMGTMYYALEKTNIKFKNKEKR